MKTFFVASLLIAANACNVQELKTQCGAFEDEGKAAGACGKIECFNAMKRYKDMKQGQGNPDCVSAGKWAKACMSCESKKDDEDEYAACVKAGKDAGGSTDSMADAQCKKAGDCVPECKRAITECKKKPMGPEQSKCRTGVANKWAKAGSCDPATIKPERECMQKIKMCTGGSSPCSKVCKDDKKGVNKRCSGVANAKAKWDDFKAQVTAKCTNGGKFVADTKTDCAKLKLVKAALNNDKCIGGELRTQLRACPSTKHPKAKEIVAECSKLTGRPKKTIKRKVVKFKQVIKNTTVAEWLADSNKAKVAAYERKILMVAKCTDGTFDYKAKADGGRRRRLAEGVDVDASFGYEEDADAAAGETALKDAEKDATVTTEEQETEELSEEIVVGDVQANSGDIVNAVGAVAFAAVASVLMH